MALRQVLALKIMMLAIVSTGVAQQPTKATAPAKAQGQAQAEKIRPVPIPGEVTSQHDRIKGLLRPAIKQKIDALVPAFREKAVKLPPQTDFQKLAEGEVRKDFPRASPQETDVLVFALLKDTLDSMSEISETTSMRLQMAMDRRSKFISTLSNMMKKISETSDSVVSNMK